MTKACELNKIYQMKKFFWLLLLIPITYFLSWTIIYAIILEGDFGYYFQYLTLNWLHQGVIPFWINMFAIMTTLFVALFYGLFLKRR